MKARKDIPLFVPVNVDYLSLYTLRAFPNTFSMSICCKMHIEGLISRKCNYLFCFSQCMSCGPGDRGHCFGPSICCGDGFGCLLGSPESAACVEENYLLTPCQAGGRPCGSDGGHCATSGLCCDAGQKSEHLSTGTA